MGRRQRYRSAGAALTLGIALLVGHARAEPASAQEPHSDGVEEAEPVGESEPIQAELEQAPDSGSQIQGEAEGEPAAEPEPPPPDTAPPRVEYSAAALAAEEAPRPESGSGPPTADRAPPRRAVLEGKDIRQRRTRMNAELGVTTPLLRGKSGVGAHIGLGSGPFAAHLGGGGLLSWSDVPVADGSWLGPYLSMAAVVTPIGGDDFELHAGLSWDAFFLTAVHPDQSYHGVAALVGGRYYLTRHMAAYARVDVFAWRSLGLELSAVPLLGSIGVAWTAWEDPHEDEEEEP